jgi:serine/threonine-protein kinase RsbW
MEPLTVSATLDSLDEIAQYVMRAATAAQIPKKSAYKLRLAVDEIATNVITYGYKDISGDTRIYLNAELDESRLTIRLEDDSPEFDPLKQVPVEESTLLAPVSERPIGGLGIFLAVDGVDEFRYERVGDRNRNTFVVKCPLEP